jgi:3-methylcrotonyl-CoA carboxylase alpha subunit
MFSRILIANRGEIACRVINTCKRLGIATVAVYSEADRDARHVRLADAAWHIGGPRPVESYLRGEKILEVAKASGAQAIHPGYGFLSENANFARACIAKGAVFIGPSPDAIEKMGSKSAAKRIMQQAGVPVVPGYHGEQQEPAFLKSQAGCIGYPQLIKAVAGGGGKGMRLVAHAGEFEVQLTAAKREAQSAFGDDAVLLERYVQGPHHIEFQVFGDGYGDVVHLFERECSIQRRHQKILEETPSPFLDADLRERMAAAAVAAAKTIGYTNAGTIEFIVGEDREFFFMEMNTRLQVEHPITEMTTSLDLVEWQLRVAAGEPLPRTQDRIHQHGHAIEVRVYAENPANNFLPDAGTVRALAWPAGLPDVRIDTGVVQHDQVGVFYDPMIAKLAAFGEDRDRAIAQMRQALARTAVLGLETNVGFLSNLLAHPQFAAGDTDTHFVETHRKALLAREARAPEAALLIACAHALAHTEAESARRAAASSDPGSPWHLSTGWRLNGETRFSLLFSDPLSGKTLEIAIAPLPGAYRLTLGGKAYDVAFEERLGDRLKLRIDGRSLSAIVLHDGSQLQVLMEDQRYALFKVDPLAFESAEEIPGGRLTALMPGRIVKILAAAGDTVTKGQPLLIMEAMKMEHTIHSPRDGVLERVFYKVDDIVQADASLFAFLEQEKM